MGELLKTQLIRTRFLVPKTVEGLSDEALAFIPDGFRNNLHWQIGHLLVTAELFLLKDKELPKSYAQLFGPGSKPEDWPEDVPSVAVLLAQLAKQGDNLQQIDVTTFDTPLEKRKLGSHTVGELAALGAFHESLHLGQIQAMTRIVEANFAKTVK